MTSIEALGLPAMDPAYPIRLVLIYNGKSDWCSKTSSIDALQNRYEMARMLGYFVTAAYQTREPKRPNRSRRDDVT